MANHRFEPKGQCYVLPQGAGYCEVLRLVRDNCTEACWPERGMNKIQKMTARPFVPSIITEEEYIIGLYPRENVFVWDGERERWVNPDVQTYGASISSLTHEIFDNHISIPLRVMSNEAADAFVTETQKRYSNLK